MEPQGPLHTTCDTVRAPQNLLVSWILNNPDRPLPASQEEGPDQQLSSPLLTPSQHLPEVSSQMTAKQLIKGDPVDSSRSDEKSLEQPLILPIPTPGRKLCVRHKRMADEGATIAMQQSLDALPLAERMAVNKIWSTFSSSSHASRGLILKGLLTMCCFSQLSLLTQELQNIIRLDPFAVLPAEISLRILKSLDAISLARAAQVSRKWRQLADDDVLWRTICEQHIDKKCAKCGWGLPRLDKNSHNLLPAPFSRTGTPSKRHREEAELSDQPMLKRKRTGNSSSSSNNSASSSRASTPTPTTPPTTGSILTRPWKKVYLERLRIERNWRRGQCSVRTLKGHVDGVMCLQFAENLATVSYPVLITGSYDHTVRVWNMVEGKEIRCMRGHTRAIRALQFDEIKLITGGMDHTLRVWNWRTGECARILEGHSQGVIALNYDADVLVSGSVDTTVRVWNFRNGSSFILSGHLDWVNAVLLWDDKTNIYTSPAPVGGPDSIIPAGKMLFSASDDGTVRLWDLVARTCVHTFSGHVGQIQSLKLLLVDRTKPELDVRHPRDGFTDDQGDVVMSSHHFSTLPSGLPGFAPANLSVPTIPAPNHPGYQSPPFSPPQGFDPTAYRHDPHTPPPNTSFSHSQENNFDIPPPPQDSEHVQQVPILISGSLDNTIRVWDVESGTSINTLFGHIEGVWAVSGDRLRVVSGSHDRTIKIWERETGMCQTTLVGHRGAVTCLALADDKIVSGSDDGDIKIWDFGLKEETDA